MKIEKVINEIYIINANNELNDIEKYKRIKRIISKFGKRIFLVGKKYSKNFKDDLYHDYPDEQLRHLLMLYKQIYKFNYV